MTDRYAKPCRIVIGRSQDLIPSRTVTPLMESELLSWLLDVERSVAGYERGKKPTK